MFEQLESWDQQLFLYLNGLHVEWMDYPMELITGIVTWIPLYLVIVYFFQRKYGWKGVGLVLVFAAFLVLVTDQVSYNGLKNTIERYRPCHNESFGHLVHVVAGCGGKYGFVSGHAANTFGIAIFSGLVLDSRKWLLGLICWAAIVSYSRIYVGVHYPGDIFGGIILGTTLGFVMANLFFLAKQKLLSGNSPETS